MFAATKFTPTPRKLRREKTTLSSNSDADKEPVQVCCRLRPLKDELIKPCIKLVSPQELLVTYAPKGVVKETCYKFKHVFTSYSTQLEVFEHLAYPLVDDLLKGKNGLLFTYGVTGSGKTYSLTGDQDNPGILPRSISTIFNSIEGFQTPKFVIKPDRMNGFEIQTEEEAICDRLKEVRTINRVPNTPRKLNEDNIYFKNDGKKIPVLNETNLFAVFVTYIEIYNNSVYDLLDESGGGPKLQSKILREDSQRNMYVNGVVEVEVKSAQEAFELLDAGRSRKKVAHTILNAESSRSHSVFNIRVVQIEKESVASGGNPIIPERNVIQIGQLSLVDLAGSERSSRTQSTGTRLKEASSINNSLMSLRSCLELLRENQQTRGKKVIPYRDSRLTYLFKNYFEGYGSVQMMVCINPTWEDLEENLQVMKFAEMSQDVKILKSNPNYTPVSVKETGAKRKATPAKVELSKMSVEGLEIQPFKFSDNPEECGLSIDRLITSLKQIKSRQVQFEEKWEEANKEFRKKLVTVSDDYISKLNEINSLKQIINRQNIKIRKLDNKNEFRGVIKTLHNTLKEQDRRLHQNRLEREKVVQSTSSGTVHRNVISTTPSCRRRSRSVGED